MNLTDLSTRQWPSVAAAVALVALVVGFAAPETVSSYNVCTDPGYPCTHERLTRQGLELYLGRIKTSVRASRASSRVNDPSPRDRAIS